MALVFGLSNLLLNVFKFSISSIFQPSFGIHIPLILKPKRYNYQTSYSNLQVCPFLPVIQLADRHSRNCSKGLKSCKNVTPFSFRRRDHLLVGKAPKRSPRPNLGAILSFCHLWLMHLFMHLFCHSSWGVDELVQTAGLGAM